MKMNEVDAAPPRRREVAEWRRGQIIDAAMAVFGRAGVDAASMKQVAAEAGIAPGLIYHYFESKEALALAVIAERGFLPELRRVLAESGGRPTREVLPLIQAEFLQLLERRAHLAGVFAPSPNANPRIREGRQEIMAEGFRLLADYFDTRVNAGELRPHDTLASAQLLLASCVFDRLIDTPPEPNAIIDIILNGIAAR